MKCLLFSSLVQVSAHDTVCTLCHSGHLHNVNMHKHTHRHAHTRFKEKCCTALIACEAKPEKVLLNKTCAGLNTTV